MSAPERPGRDDRTPRQRARDARLVERSRERADRLALRTRMLGLAMRNAPSMHISTMSRRDLERDQTLRHLPRPLLRLVFGRPHRGVRTTDRVIEGPGGRLHLRVYRPSTRPGGAPAAIYLHGGGWTLFGGLDACDWLPSRVAALAGIVVVAVDYRLAPQHPYPAAVQDAVAATRWVAEHSDDLGLDGRLAVFGDSAGGNLAAVVSLALRDDGPPLAAQGLVYPVTSTTLVDDSMLANAEQPVLRRADMATFLAHYLGDPEAFADDPLVAPLSAPDLAGLPPALVQVAGHDVLRDQGIAYAERLRDAHVPTSLQRYPRAAHGWVTYPALAPDSGPATEALALFLRRHLLP